MIIGILSRKQKVLLILSLVYWVELFYCSACWSFLAVLNRFSYFGVNKIPFFEWSSCVLSARSLTLPQLLLWVLFMQTSLSSLDYLINSRVRRVTGRAPPSAMVPEAWLGSALEMESGLHSASLRETACRVQLAVGAGGTAQVWERDPVSKNGFWTSSLVLWPHCQIYTAGGCPSVGQYCRVFNLQTPGTVKKKILKTWFCFLNHK